MDGHDVKNGHIRREMNDESVDSKACLKSSINELEWHPSGIANRLFEGKGET